MKSTHDVIISPVALEIQERVQRGEPVLKAIRESLGYTQNEFAQIMYTNVTTVSRWENSGKEPLFRMSQVKALARELAKIRLTLEHLPDELRANESED
jgi:DNA-binding transcriptional regulator YiaG